MSEVIGNLGVTRPFRVVRGTDAAIAIAITEGGEVKALTGYTASMLVLPQPKSTNALDTLTTENGRIEIDEEAGIITLLFAAEATAAAAWDRGVYRLNLINASGASSRLFDGPFALVRESGDTSNGGAAGDTSFTVETVNALTLNITPFDITGNIEALIDEEVEARLEAQGALNIAFDVPGKPFEDQIIKRIPILTPVRHPAGMPGSRASATVASIGAKVITFYHERAGVLTAYATATYTSSATAVVTSAAHRDFADGDYFVAKATGAQDAALDYLSFALAGVAVP